MARFDVTWVETINHQKVQEVYSDEDCTVIISNIFRGRTKACKDIRFDGVLVENTIEFAGKMLVMGIQMPKTYTKPSPDKRGVPFGLAVAGRVAAKALPRLK